MTTRIQERSGQEAVAGLRALRDRYKDRPRGQTLTLKIIADQCGVNTLATVSWWLTEGENHHEPQGATLVSLSKFLERAERDPAWVEKLITKKARK